jgi:hypothetical protein
LKPLVEEESGDQQSILDLLGKLRYLADRKQGRIYVLQQAFLLDLQTNQQQNMSKLSTEH